MIYKPKLVIAVTVCLLISQSMATTIYDANGVTFTLDSFSMPDLLYTIETPIDAHSTLTFWFALVWYGNLDGSAMDGPGTYDAILFERLQGFPQNMKLAGAQMVIGEGPSFNITLVEPGQYYAVDGAGSSTSPVQVSVTYGVFPDFTTFENWGCMVHTTDQAPYAYTSEGSRDEVQNFMINGESYCPGTGTTSCFCGTGISCTLDTGDTEGTEIGGKRSEAFRMAVAGVITAALANNFF